MGLCVAACRLLLNGRLGVTGGFSELLSRTLRGSAAFDWRGWFALGVIAAGTLALVVFGDPVFEGYGWMTETFTGAEQWVLVPLLLGSGVLVGYGAKQMGGCTSGNGLSGTSSLSPAALVATGTFFATAIVVATAIEAAI